MAVKYLDAKRIQGSSGSGGSGSPNSEGTTPTVDSTNTAIYGVNSLSYDGANDGNNTQSASAVLPSGFTKCTISCWLRANEFNNDYAVILKGNPDTNDNDWVGIQAVSGGFKATVGSDSGSQVSCTSSGVSADEWHLVVLIYDGTESSSNDRLKLYVDDDSVVQPSSGTVNTSNDYAPYLCIGQIGTNQDNNTYKGNAQDVGIWNIALTEANVDTLYGTKSGTGNAGSSTTGVAISDASLGTGLRCYYKLDSTTIPNSADDKATLVTPAEADGYAIGDGSGDYAYGSGASSYNFVHDGSLFSLSYWIYRNGEQNDNAVIVGDADEQSTHVGFLTMLGTSEKIKFGVYVDGEGGASTTGVDTDDQTWTHITITGEVDGSNNIFRVYKNGVNNDNATDTITIATADLNTGNASTSLNVFRNAFGSGNKVDGRVADIGFWEDHTLSSGDITKLKNGQRITDDGTGFDYSSSDIVHHYPLFTDTNDTKGSYNLTNSGLTFGSTSAPTATSASSNLPENTIFNETDTYTQYFLQNDNWVATPLTKFNTQSNWSPLVSGNTIESGTSPQSYYFDQDTSGTNTLELPFSCDVNNCTIDWDKNSQSATTSGDTWTDINIATSSVGYGASSNGHSKIDIYQSSSAVDKYTINANSGSSDANTNEDSTGNMTLPTQDTWFYYRLTWKTNSDGTMTFKYRRYTDYARTTLSSLGTDAVGTASFSVSDTAQWTPANLKYINITNVNSIRPSRYANLCITNGIALPQVDE